MNTLNKPECPFCFESCNDPNCSVIHCDGTKELCPKSLYCSIYIPNSVFCNPDTCCEEKLKKYIKDKIEKGVDAKFKKILNNIKQQIEE